MFEFHELRNAREKIYRLLPKQKFVAKAHIFRVLRSFVIHSLAARHLSLVPLSSRSAVWARERTNANQFNSLCNFDRPSTTYSGVFSAAAEFPRERKDAGESERNMSMDVSFSGIREQTAADGCSSNSNELTSAGRTSSSKSERTHNFSPLLYLPVLAPRKTRTRSHVVVCTAQTLSRGGNGNIRKQPYVLFRGAAAAGVSTQNPAVGWLECRERVRTAASALSLPSICSIHYAAYVCPGPVA